MVHVQYLHRKYHVRTFLYCYFLNENKAILVHETPCQFVTALLMACYKDSECYSKNHSSFMLIAQGRVA
jgi:hypothetical protein